MSFFSGPSSPGGQPYHQPEGTTSDRLLHIADQQSQVECGSPEADRIIHKALGRGGPVLAYTRNEAAARLLLPEGFEWRADTYSAGFVYASCRRMGIDGAFLHPHHGQQGQTLPLAMCGAVMQAYAAWQRAEPGSAEGGSDGDG